MASNRAPVLCVRPALMAIEISKQSGHEAEYMLAAEPRDERSAASLRIDVIGH
jgi:hypothetical protein